MSISLIIDAWWAHEVSALFAHREAVRAHVEYAGSPARIFNWWTRLLDLFPEHKARLARDQRIRLRMWRELRQEVI